MERSEAMLIRGSPDGARHPRPQAGRDRPEWMVAINRNDWSESIGNSGRNYPVRAFGTNRMLALVTASQMASASAASFFCRLT
jgi:hypothetical protein